MVGGVDGRDDRRGICRDYVADSGVCTLGLTPAFHNRYGTITKSKRSELKSRALRVTRSNRWSSAIAAWNASEVNYTAAVDQREALTTERFLIALEILGLANASLAEWVREALAE